MVSENATSLRSYREREAQLNKILQEDMPKNRNDIQAAKEFGDLSENFEYETARNMERQLITRMENLRRELASAKIYDFDVTPDLSNGVTIGCRVTIAYNTGENRCIAILGAWDFDERLDIVSSRGNLAECLYGAQPGDTVSLPDPDFDGEYLEAVVQSVEPLTDEIRAWARNA